MNGAQIAHFLKIVGRGSEVNGIVMVFKSGITVGVGSTVLIGAAGYGVYRLARWGITKCCDYQQQRHNGTEVVCVQ